MYPLKLDKYFIEKVWGGYKLKKFLQDSSSSQHKTTSSSSKKYGESWEVSAREKVNSVIMNGKFEGQTLQEVINKFQDKILGAEVVKKYKKKFPLLIKYLDINDRLSVQVHPNDNYAKKTEGEFGKTESWYILDASRDAEIILGVKKGIRRSTLFKYLSGIIGGGNDRKKSSADSIAGSSGGRRSGHNSGGTSKDKNRNRKKLEKIFNIQKVRRGDCISIPAGLVHASISGRILGYEIQENSDLTYRIYDFDRLVDGRKRKLHIEKALQTIKFGLKPKIMREENQVGITLSGAKKYELIRGKHFNLDKLVVDALYSDNVSSNFKIYSVIAGIGDMICDGIKYSLSRGDTYLIPASLSVQLVAGCDEASGGSISNRSGNLEILKSYL